MAENDLVESLRRIEGIFEPDQAVIHVHAEGSNVLIEGNRDGLLSVAICNGPAWWTDFLASTVNDEPSRWEPLRAVLSLPRRSRKFREAKGT